MSVPDITRKDVWDTLCDLEWHMRYFGAMADRRQKAHRLVRFALLLGIAVEGGVLYGGTFYPWLFYVGILGGIALAGLTIWDALSNYAGDVAVFRMMASMCGLLRRETEELWRGIEVGTISASEAETVLKSVHGRWDGISQWVQSEVDQSLNLASAEAANAEIVNRYAS